MFKMNLRLSASLTVVLRDEAYLLFASIDEGRPEGLVHCCKDLLSFGLADLNAVAAICQNFRLHNGYQSVFLAQSSIASQPICIFMDTLHDEKLFSHRHF